MMATTLLAMFAAIVGLGFVATLWAATVAESPARFSALMLSGSVPFIWYFTSQFVISVAFVPMVLAALDKFENNRTNERSWTRLIGFLSGMVVTVIGIAYPLYWSVAGCYGDSCALKKIKTDLFAAYARGFEAFCQTYNVTDLIVYFITAWLTVAVFARPISVRNQKPSTRPSRQIPGSPALPLILLVAVVALLPSVGAAGDLDGKVVVGGFRSDAEPFSFLPEEGAGSHYQGYTAQFCYDIFAGNKYRFIQQQVTATDRFSRLRKTSDPDSGLKNGRLEDDKIDILCDPTTLRFSPEVVSTEGIFSPIIFVTGASYLLRPTRSPGKDAYLAFVRGTTASDLAVQACKVDRFGVLRRAASARDCSISRNERCDVDPADHAAKYWFCVFDSHTQLIQWFCDPETAPERQLVYFGDREIILSKHEAWSRQYGCPASIEKDQNYYTYEPYALLVSKKDPELYQFVQRRIYDIFSNRAEARGIFTSNFPNVTISPTLANLFLLNAVQDDTKYHASDLPANASLPDPN